MRNRLLILTYHRVLDEPDAYRTGDIQSGVFDRLMGMLASFFNVLPLHEAAAKMHAGTLPSRAVCITFDDGYADNAELALPILKRHRIAGTFFVAPGFLDGGRMWNDSVIECIRQVPGNRLDLSWLGLGERDVSDVARRRTLLRELLPAIKHNPPEQRLAQVQELIERTESNISDAFMMRAEQVRELHDAGMEVGAHTINHPILQAITDKQAAEEIYESREQLQDIIAHPVRTFAYPNGKPEADYGRQHVQMLAENGFDYAVTTAWGCARAADDPLQLPRVGPWDTRRLPFALRLLKSYMGAQAQQLPRTPSNASASAAA